MEREADQQETLENVEVSRNEIVRQFLRPPMRASSALDQKGYVKHCNNKQQQRRSETTKKKTRKIGRHISKLMLGPGDQSPGKQGEGMLRMKRFSRLTEDSTIPSVTVKPFCNGDEIDGCG